MQWAIRPSFLPYLEPAKPVWKHTTKRIPGFGPELCLNLFFYVYDDPLLYLYTGRHALGFTMPSGRIYSDDAKRQADQFVTAMPAKAREHGLDYVMLTASDFYREEHTQPPLTLTAHDPKLHQEFAVAK